MSQVNKETAPIESHYLFIRMQKGKPYLVEMTGGKEVVTPIISDVVSEGGPGSGNWGHAGMAGQLGGSAPGGGLGAIGTSIDASPDEKSAAVAARREEVAAQKAAKAEASALRREEKQAMGLSGMKTGADAQKMFQEQVSIADDNRDKVENLVNGTARAIATDIGYELTKGSEWIIRSNEVQRYVKGNLVKGITADSGLAYNDVNEMVANWAKTSNDTREETIAMQESASEVFGTPLTEWQRGRRVAVDASRANVLDDDRILGFSKEQTERHMVADIRFKNRYNADQREAFLRTQYDRTQTELRGQGIKPDDLVTLYRGIAMPEATVDRIAGKALVVRDNALVSTSTNRDTAIAFARGVGGEPMPPGHVGVLATMQVRARDIVGMATTGYGCLAEREIVIVGRGSLGIVTRQ